VVAAVDGLHFGVVGVTDMDASLDFYCGLLQFTLAQRQGGGQGRAERCLLTSGGRQLVLQGLGEQPGQSAWVNDDLQSGMRHIGLKVDDVDAWAERARDRGARFTVEPEDAFGDVRLCFFLDPDGAHLEFVQGNVNYNLVWTPELVARERAVPVPGSPRFDHVALSVADLDATLAFYQDHLGFPVIAQLKEDNADRGFMITFVQAGPGVLEIFSFSEPMQANSFSPAERAPGLLYLGMGARDVAAAAADLEAGGAMLVPGARPEGEPPGSVLATDGDGTPLEVVPI
jgi:catechol 2,3-dioxygenase-like lactoylglutathione lyase family enzyme